MSLSLSLLRTTIYVLEDYSTPNALGFALTFGVQGNAHIQDMEDMSATIKLIQFRFSRTEKNLTVLPCDYSDFLQPINLMVSTTLNENNELKVDVSTNTTFVIRSGLRDYKLLMKCVEYFTNAKNHHDQKVAIQDVVPVPVEAVAVEGVTEGDTDGIPEGVTDAIPVEGTPEVVTEAMAEAVAVEGLEPVEKKSFPFSSVIILATLSIPTISILLANDSSNTDTPVFFIKMSTMDIQMHYISSFIDMICSVAVKIDVYNLKLNIYEPFMEEWTLSVIYKKISEEEIV